MRKPKKSGFWKIHQDCGVCQKPRRHKKRSIEKERKRVDKVEMEEWSGSYNLWRLIEEELES